MKFWKEIKKGLLIASMAIALTGIVGSNSSKASTAADRNSEITTLNLNTQKETPKYYIIKGKTKKFSLKNDDGLDFSASGIWTSSNKKVATVNRNGLVRARMKGKAIISVTYNGATYNSLVVVQTPKLSKTTLTITEGKSRLLRLKGNGQKVTWYSKKPSIATVDENGKVTAVSEGKVKIIAQIKDTRYKKSYGCWVTVKPDPNAEKEPETETPETTPLENNYAELKKYISTYGATNNEGNKFIRYEKLEKGNIHTSAIIYEHLSDKFHFIYTYVSESGKTKASVDTYIDCTKYNSFSPQIILSFISGNTTKVLKSSTTIPTAIYQYSKTRNITFTLTTNYGYSSTEAQDSSYTLFFNAMLAWDRDLLEAKANLSLQDLGFYSYVRPSDTN